MKKKQGNVSILVLFVLVATSLIGVLTMSFIKQMLYSSGNMLSYYRSYYLANAGLELLVTQANHRGIGWETSVLTGNQILSQNFDCVDCDITANIDGNASYLSKSFWRGTGCEDPFVLGNRESLLLPLFKDISSGSVWDAFTTPSDYENLSVGLSSMVIETYDDTAPATEISLGMLILSGDELYSDGLFFRPSTLQSQAVSDFLEEFEEHAADIEPFENSNNTLLSYYTQQADNYHFLNYFIIANTSSEAISFCISSYIDLPTSNFLISSNGRWGNQTIGLELVAPQNIPSFLLNSYFGDF